MPDTRPDDAPPNVVVVFTDDQGFGDVGCFGSPYIDTPNLDRMADEGVRLTSFCVGAPICTPSRAALLTGSYPNRVGLGSGVLFPDDDEGLAPDERTVADALSAAGYATACVGKWHLGDHERFLPTNHGFDSYLGVPYSNDMGAAHSEGQYRELPLLRDTETVAAPVEQATLTRRYTEEALSFVETHRDEPFFLYLPHTMPHVPLHASEAFDGESYAGDYGDVIEEIDWSVGRLLDRLDELGLSEDTLVVFTSDNGPWLEKGVDGGDAGPLRGGKFETWEGGVRVPAIARWPGEIPAGTVCRELVTAMDLFPTAAALADATLPAERPIDGENVLPLLRDPEGADSPHDYYAYHDAGGNLQAIRNAVGWKLHRDREELYYLPEDVGETVDRYDDHPDVVERLRTAADRIEADIDTNSRPAGSVADD
jgi:arylsulfatase A-like enzyme